MIAERCLHKQHLNPVAKIVRRSAEGERVACHTLSFHGLGSGGKDLMGIGHPYGVKDP
jgi:hypothetical protein